ncbi:hypothetical protein HDU82_003258 [Entophlyctis luteolus]|nr:hypothetical protein HDU82_003258 [Entophlyctis luteolus]
MADESTLTVTQSGTTVTYTLTLSTGYTLLHSLDSIAVTFTLDGTTACNVASTGVIGFQTSWACNGDAPATTETGTISAEVSIGSSTTFTISDTADLTGTKTATSASTTTTTSTTTAAAVLSSSSLSSAKTTAVVQNTLTSTGLATGASSTTITADNASSTQSSSSSSSTNYAVIGGVAGGIVLAVILVIAYVVNKRTQRRKRREVPELEWNAPSPEAPAGLTNSAYNNAKPIGLEKLAPGPAGGYAAGTNSPNVAEAGLDYSAPQYLGQVASPSVAAQYGLQGYGGGGAGQSVQYPGYYDAAGQYHYYTQDELAAQQRR